ncbi:hypothetical protein LOTGIDRAFT_156040 [Lottia gigantea]|uniref:Exonuclease domain-containing protein n=1 Tax=Lottia gigantea TaxID=225164 RepID=V4BFW3_LOTGI|nr:hypothetical protein LOTGIDRAFT_156040 [Lottia gigantea]ESP04817.1 hypothetical protein LOTGIDRAFT_156040 [Lottia gigantea]
MIYYTRRKPVHYTRKLNIQQGGKEIIMATSKKQTFIMFDLETTGLYDKENKEIPHITQIAASELDSNKLFSTYVLPKVPISPGAEEVNGTKVTEDGIMTVHGKNVEHVSITIAIQKLFKWLKNFPNVVLVAHYGRKFDFPVIASAFVNTNTVDLFLNNVTNLIDSWKIFWKLYPGQSHKQVDLAKSLLDITYDADNAIADVETLGKLIKFIRISPEDLLSYRFSPQSVIDDL